MKREISFGRKRESRFMEGKEEEDECLGELDVRWWEVELLYISCTLEQLSVK
jgi:hypothetical protein